MKISVSVSLSRNGRTDIAKFLGSKLLSLKLPYWNLPDPLHLIKDFFFPTQSSSASPPYSVLQGVKREMLLSEQTCPFSKHVTAIGMHFGHWVEGCSTQRISVSVPCIFPDGEMELLRSKTSRCLWCRCKNWAELHHSSIINISLPLLPVWTNCCSVWDQDVAVNTSCTFSKFSVFCTCKLGAGRCQQWLFENLRDPWGPQGGLALSWPHCPSMGHTHRRHLGSALHGRIHGERKGKVGLYSLRVSTLSGKSQGSQQKF